MFELTIIIPAYNEEKSLESFLPIITLFCESNNYKLIVVNDGSKDKTKSILLNAASQKPFFSVINHKLNKGYGAAIKAGIEKAETEYIVTIDADGQHNLNDVKEILSFCKINDADMVVGCRKKGGSSTYRNIGKWIIRKIAAMLMPLPIFDLNSGLKLYKTSLAKKYIKLCPNNMAYSDVIALVYISQRHLVLEKEITINQRIAGESTISTKTAIDTVREIINIVVLFNPMRIFIPLSILFILASIAWGLPIILQGKGVSVGAMLGIITGIIFFVLGLIAEQIGLLRKQNV